MSEKKRKKDETQKNDEKILRWRPLVVIAIGGNHSNETHKCFSFDKFPEPIY